MGGQKLESIRLYLFWKEATCIVPYIILYDRLSFVLFTKSITEQNNILMTIVIKRKFNWELYLVELSPINAWKLHCPIVSLYFDCSILSKLTTGVCLYYVKVLGWVPFSKGKNKSTICSIVMESNPVAPHKAILIMLRKTYN